MKEILPLLVSLIVLPGLSVGQQQVAPADLRTGALPPAAQPSGNATTNASRASTTVTGSFALSPDYVIGPGDVLTMSEVNLEDTGAYQDRTFRVDNGGDATFPVAGRVHVAGMTTGEVEAQVNERLRKVVKEPEAVIGIAEFHSQPISVLGSVNSPGIIPISGPKNLFEVLSLAGGIRPDAGNSIVITRSLKSGVIPLPNAKTDPTAQFSVASVKVKTVMAGTDPAQNINIMPEDVITVPKGEVVYAVGAVNRPGGFLLGENGSLSTLQVISLAEGLVKTSAPSRAEILRTVAGSSSRLQIAVNIKELMKGKAPDLVLQPDDILFIPNSGAKTVGYQAITSAIGFATGAAIYGKF